MATGDTDAMRAAVRAVDARRRALGVTVTQLALRLEADGYPVRRETLSRVLHERQPTTWETIERMWLALGGSPGLFR